MKAIGVATDSCSGITQEEAKKLGVLVLPMPFYFGEECYLEGVSINREEFIKRLEEGQAVSTSQPSPESVIELWREGLKEYEKLIYIPISSGLSGSYSTAKMLADDEEFEGRVLVVDSGRVSTPLHRMIFDALDLIKKGLNADEIVDVLQKMRDKMSIYVAVETLEYLRKGGRVSATTAVVGSLLNIKPILRFDVGMLEAVNKCRGMKKARQKMLELLKAELEAKFPEGFTDKVHLLAASSADEETTKSWEEEIKEFFPGMEVQSDYLTLNLSCHIGPNGLGIAYSQIV